MTSIANGDSALEIAGKTALGGIAGHISGNALGALGKSGASLPVIKAAATVVETGFDTAIDLINGNKVTKETVGSALAINVVFNLPIGSAGKVTKYSHLSDQEVADKFVRGLNNSSANSSWGVKQFDSAGGYMAALRDFDSLGLKDVRVINTSFGEGKLGVLPDGTKVVVRQGSTSNLGATIEFQLNHSVGGRKYEVRYGE